MSGNEAIIPISYAPRFPSVKTSAPNSEIPTGLGRIPRFFSIIQYAFTPLNLSFRLIHHKTSPAFQIKLKRRALTRGAVSVLSHSSARITPEPVVHFCGTRLVRFYAAIDNLRIMSVFPNCTDN